ncbi:MAG TPA: hypothetical protein VFC38_08225 [Stellaceae bacterium]|nr:hypothetical protein [Stellaceae bacterium]
MSVRTGSGLELQKEWKIDVAKAYYHHEGTWFNRLKQFPGALCDQNGYVRFETEADYLNSPYLDVNVQTNVHQSISQIPNYVRMR